MNKELTAMQMLIHELKQMKHGVEDRIISIHLGHCISKANRLLQKEQEQIENAFKEGYMDCIGEDAGLDKYKDANGKDYYKSKYGGEI